MLAYPSIRFIKGIATITTLWFNNAVTVAVVISFLQ